MMVSRRNRNMAVVVILAIALSFFRPHFYGLRSLVVMWPYSLYHEQMSLLKQKGFSLKMPTRMRDSHQNWYPFMIVFHDGEGFATWTGEPWALTVLYRFGAFVSGQDHSSYYSRDSNRFSSFYGAYLIQHQEDASNHYFGFTAEGEFVPEAFIEVTEYDQRYLVMPSLGLPPGHVIFEVELLDQEEDITYLHRDGWTRVDARVKTNSPEHHFRNHQQGYLQYGLPIPPPDGEEDFYPVTIYGRIYARKMESSQMSLALYILAPDMDSVQDIDSSLLSKTKLSSESLN